MGEDKEPLVLFTKGVSEDIRILITLSTDIVISYSI